MRGKAKKQRRVATKLTFSDDAPVWYQRVWKGVMPRMGEYARFAKVSIDEVHVHWHADQRRNSCSLGEALGAKITLCTTPTDEDTFIHEVAHIGIAGQHSAKWAKLFVDMAKHFLPKYRAAAAIYDAWKSYKSIAVVCPNPMEEL